MYRTEQRQREPDMVGLILSGLARRDSNSHKKIRENMTRLARGLGDAWLGASRQEGAGMVLLALAQNSALRQHLNSEGWGLIASFVTANPEIARHISPRGLAEISSPEASRTSA